MPSISLPVHRSSFPPDTSGYMLLFKEELARKAVEEQERAMAREREIEAERKRMAEEMERVKKEQIERALAEARKV